MHFYNGISKLKSFLLWLSKPLKPNSSGCTSKRRLNTGKMDTLLWIWSPFHLCQSCRFHPDQRVWSTTWVSGLSLLSVADSQLRCILQNLYSHPEEKKNENLKINKEIYEYFIFFIICYNILKCLWDRMCR